MVILSNINTNLFYKAYLLILKITIKKILFMHNIE
jgi:hypothetical protein